MHYIRKFVINWGGVFGVSWLASTSFSTCSTKCNVFYLTSSTKRSAPSFIIIYAHWCLPLLSVCVKSTLTTWTRELPQYLCWFCTNVHNSKMECLSVIHWMQRYDAKLITHVCAKNMGISVLHYYSPKWMLEACQWGNFDELNLIQTNANNSASARSCNELDNGLREHNFRGFCWAWNFLFRQFARQVNTNVKTCFTNKQAFIGLQVWVIGPGLEFLGIVISKVIASEIVAKCIWATQFVNSKYDLITLFLLNNRKLLSKVW